MKKQKLFASLGCAVFSVVFVSSAFGQKDIDKRIETTILKKATDLNEGPKEFSIQRSVHDKKNNLDFHYVQQTINGLPLLNGTAVLVEKDGNMRMTGNRLISVKATNLPKKASLDPVQAVDLVWNQIGNGTTTTPSQMKKVKEGILVSNAMYSHSDIPVSLAYFFDGENYRLVYDMSFEMLDNVNWWSIYADAATGEVVYKNNWTVSCSFEGCSPSEHATKHEWEENHFLQFAPAPPPSTDTYRAVPIPNESPVHGTGIQLITGPANLTASPFGWHDDNGIAGEEYTITRGNNVYASEDRDDDNQPGYSPDGGSTLNFDYPVITTDSADGFLDAAIVNLFYMNNIMHDVWYFYGFDEQSGNFQENNYGNGGNASDNVNAQAQDGSGTNNANFSTPPDGSNPRMQMYLWNGNGAPGRIIQINNSSVAGKYTGGVANFGPKIDTVPLTADLMLAADSSGNDPIDACSQIVVDLTGKIAYVRKGGCDYDVKAANCEAAGAIGMMVMNTSLGNPLPMNVSNPQTVNIPSVMIGNNPGVTVLTKLTNGETINVTLRDHGWYGLTDSDFDNGVIAHEYGHGISNRLTGGPSAANCLGNQEQMGEGWSDFFGLMVTMEPGDQGGDRRGIGTYVSNEENDGGGIRPAPYSTNMSINPYTYNATNNPSITRPHGIGFVWCTMLWDLNWAMIDKYGFDSDVYTGTGGNNRTMNLVMNGLKLQPCGPGFIDGRDAILEANALLYDSLDQCMIWQVFANRGLGASAEQGGANNRSDQVESFDLPAFCITGLTETQAAEQTLRLYPNPAKDVLNVAIHQDGKIEKITMVDLNGRLVYDSDNINSAKTEINLGDFKPGFYMVQIYVGGQVITRKIIKE